MHKIKVEQLTNDHQINLLGPNETMLHRDILDREVSADGYKIYKYARGTAGDDVATYAKNLCLIIKEDIVDPNLEIVGIEITPKTSQELSSVM